MLESNLKERIIKAKKELEDKYIIFYNNGANTTTNTKRLYEEEKISNINNGICEILEKANESYIRFNYNFDTLEMLLLVGIIYKMEDVNEDLSIKEGAKPINEIVHYYTSNVNSYLNNEKTNIADYYEYAPGRQGCINYDELIHNAHLQGIEIEGPKTFQELVNKINNSEIFDIKTVLNLNDDKVLKRKLK